MLEEREGKEKVDKKEARR